MAADSRNGFVLSAEGGRILQWRVEGKNILFPDQTIEVRGERKQRGGMFWCCPNFGLVDQKYGLPQHGLLRDMVGDMVGPNILATHKEVGFEGTGLLGKKPRRRSLVQVSAWKPDPRRLSYELTVRLSRNRKIIKGLPFNPGAHSYFATPQGEATVRVCGIYHHVVAREYDDSLPFDGHAEIEIPGIGNIDLWVSPSMIPSGSRLVLWLDDRRYLCIEPVLGSPQDFGVPGKGKFLKAGELFSAKIELKLR